MTDRQLIRLARDELTVNEFHVWFAKHYRHLGRRAGSNLLEISETEWRHRLARALTKMDYALQRKDTAA